jgi:hypothetical protein
MSWHDFYQRRDALDAVLEHAGRHPGVGLPFDESSSVRAVFADRESLALALQYKWSQVLMGHLGVALSDAEDTEDIDHVAAVAAAWRRAAREQPALRDLLDTHAQQAGPEFRRARHAEQRMLAYAAGLAETGDPADETARVGAAFLALVRAPGTRPVTRRTSPVEQLFRRLVASA